MGRDRQEKKLKNKKQVESDRDQSLHYGGAARFEKEGEAGKNIND